MHHILESFQWGNKKQLNGLAQDTVNSTAYALELP